MRIEALLVSRSDDPLLADQLAGLGTVGPLVAIDLRGDRAPRIRFVLGIECAHLTSFPVTLLTRPPSAGTPPPLGQPAPTPVDVGALIAPGEP